MVMRVVLLLMVVFGCSGVEYTTGSLAAVTDTVEFDESLEGNYNNNEDCHWQTWEYHWSDSSRWKFRKYWTTFDGEYSLVSWQALDDDNMVGDFSMAWSSTSAAPSNFPPMPGGLSGGAGEDTDGDGRPDGPVDGGLSGEGTGENGVDWPVSGEGDPPPYDCLKFPPPDAESGDVVNDDVVIATDGMGGLWYIVSNESDGTWAVYQQGKWLESSPGEWDFIPTGFLGDMTLNADRSLDWDAANGMEGYFPPSYADWLPSWLDRLEADGSEAPEQAEAPVGGGGSGGYESDGPVQDDPDTVTDEMGTDMGLGAPDGTDTVEESVDELAETVEAAADHLSGEMAKGRTVGKQRNEIAQTHLDNAKAAAQQAHDDVAHMERVIEREAKSTRRELSAARQSANGAAVTAHDDAVDVRDAIDSFAAQNHTDLQNVADALGGDTGDPPPPEDVAFANTWADQKTRTDDVTDAVLDQSPGLPDLGTVTPEAPCIGIDIPMVDGTTHTLVWGPDAPGTALGDLWSMMAMLCKTVCTIVFLWWLFHRIVAQISGAEG